MSRKKKINANPEAIDTIEPTANVKTTADVVAEAMQAKWGKKVMKTKAEVVLEEEPTWHVDDSYFCDFGDDVREIVIRAWKYYGSLRHNPALTAEIVFRQFLTWSEGLANKRYETMDISDWEAIEEELCARVNGK